MIVTKKKSYSIYKYISESAVSYDYIHFHDYKGLGFFSLAAKRQGIAFRSSVLVVQAHGPTRWTIDANKAVFAHPDQLRIDFMEKRCIEWADYLISPSQYLLDWMGQNGYSLPGDGRSRVIKNVCTLAAQFAALAGHTSGLIEASNEIIYFARHEERKGFVAFCDAIDLISNELVTRGVAVTFLGKLGEINGYPSGVELTNRAKKWEMPLRIKTQLDRYGALNYLASNPRSTVVIPSPTENSPYTVLEASVIGKPVVTSAEGGAKELIAPELHDKLLAEISSAGLSRRLREAVVTGLPAAKPAETQASIEAQWLTFHSEHRLAVHPKEGGVTRLSPVILLGNPKVVFGITHYERTQKLTEALVSAMRQDYENIEIVVIDDGSTSEEAKAGLSDIQRILSRIGGKLIRQENQYLGAARNSIARETKSDYLLFLDDDDLAFRNLTSTLVTAAVSTGADITGCFNIFMEEQLRAGAAPSPESFKGKLSYAPLGGPLSVAPFENWLGAATALISRTHFERIGGYTELKGVGFEDYEFFFRSLQAGAKLEVVPEPLYLYETGRPSMLSRTSLFHNYRRVLEAVDLQAAPEAWRDLIAMNTGRKIIEERSSKISWEYRISPKSDVLIPLLDRSVSPDDYAQRLVNYAHAVGASNIARSWEVSTQVERLNKVVNKNNDLSAFGRFEPPAVFVPKYAMMPRDLEIVAAIKLGRIADAGRDIICRLKRSHVIDQSISDLLRLFIQKIGDGDQEIADEMLSAITETEARPDICAAVIVSCIVLAQKFGHAELVRAMLYEQFMLDEAEYGEIYPEVKDAVENRKILVNGLQHYERHGFIEGRVGYRRLATLAHECSNLLGVDIKPWTIAEFFGFTFEKSPVFDKRHIFPRG